MMCSDRIAQLEEQHNERSEDRIVKTKNLFIDGQWALSKNALNCIANMIMFLTWIYVNGHDTFWGKQLLGIFNLHVSDAGRSWLDYIVSTHPHTPFNLIMECQVIQQAIYINMVKNQPWTQHIQDNLKFPFNKSLGRVSLTGHLPQSTISIAIAGFSHHLSIPHQMFDMMNCRGSPNLQRSNTNNNNNNTNNQQGNFKQQQGNQNNGNNGGNRNNCDIRNTDDRLPPTDNNKNNGPIGGIMTEVR